MKEWGKKKKWGGLGGYNFCLSAFTLLPFSVSLTLFYYFFSLKGEEMVQVMYMWIIMHCYSPVPVFFSYRDEEKKNEWLSVCCSSSLPNSIPPSLIIFRLFFYREIKGRSKWCTYTTSSSSCPSSLIGSRLHRLLHIHSERHYLMPLPLPLEWLVIDRQVCRAEPRWKGWVLQCYEFANNSLTPRSSPRERQCCCGEHSGLPGAL